MRQFSLPLSFSTVSVDSRFYEHIIGQTNISVWFDVLLSIVAAGLSGLPAEADLPVCCRPCRPGFSLP